LTFTARETDGRDNSGTRDLNERSAAAQYVAGLSSDLAALARMHGFATLGYLLEMAQLEAENAARLLEGSKRAR
jgi:hypothetical protein